MKKTLTLIAMVAITMLVAAASFAAPGTLYQQEGTTADGPAGIDATGRGPAGDAGSLTNWKWQAGGGSSSGVYAGDLGWLDGTPVGTMAVKIEADVEMFVSQTIENNEIYFHLGNLFTATNADKTANITGTATYNNGMYLGIQFAHGTKTAADFELATGRIINGMQSDNDTWRAQNNKMDLQILMSWGAGYRTPDTFGVGAHGTITDTLWWLVDGGTPGSYNLDWQVKLLPTTYQPDGDYYLDPAFVSAPVL